MEKCISVAITGAAGHIGYALAFRIASGQMFGPNVKVKLKLIELESQLSALKGVAMELDDCAFELLQEVTCTADLGVGFADVSWAILVGAVPRTQGMERADLLKINANIFTLQGKMIDEYAAPNVKVLVVGNPCNTNCLIAKSTVTRVNSNNFYAMTMLDQNRAAAQLAGKAGASVADVENCIVWGNHSATQFPDFTNATIKGKLATDIITDNAWLEQEFIQTVQQRGAAIIKARGLSSAASAANAIVDTVTCCEGMHGDKAFSLALTSNGEYGVDKGLVFSFPCRYVSGKVVIDTSFTQNDFSSSKLAATLLELKQERDAVTEMGLI
jgi:malate dehydrogenase